MEYDLYEATFDGFTRFYFDHPVTKADPWYFEADVLYEPLHNANFFITLFRNPGFLLEQQYSREQLDQGFWALSSYGLDGNAYSIVLEANELDFDVQRAVVESMFELFTTLFAVDPIGQSSAFWWNHFTDFRTDRSTQLGDVIFETLLRLLYSDSGYCKGCALAGIRNLRHERTAEVLRAYVRGRNNMDAVSRSNILKIAEENPPYPR